MGKIKLYKNIGLVVWIIVTVILAYIVFKPNEKIYDESFLNARIDTLQKEKKVLINNVMHRDSLNEISKKEISYISLKNDSLLTVISKIPTKYEGLYSKANNATANVLVAEFTNIFTNNNIK